MGQYHITVNFTKREWINPYKIGMGLKLREQCGEYYGTPHLLFLMLSTSNGRGGGDILANSPNYSKTPLDIKIPKCSGRWAGDRIAVVGDYTECDDIPWAYEDLKVDESLDERGYKKESLYSYVKSNFKDITDELLPDFEAAFGLKCEDKKYDGWRTFKKVREV